MTAFSGTVPASMLTLVNAYVPDSRQQNWKLAEDRLNTKRQSPSRRPRQPGAGRAPGPPSLSSRCDKRGIAVVIMVARYAKAAKLAVRCAKAGYRVREGDEAGRALTGDSSPAGNAVR